MKALNHIFKLVACVVMLGISGCSDFLDEKSVTDITIDSYVVDAKGFENLVKSCYPLLRNIHRERNLVLNGTDIFCAATGYNRIAQLTGSELDLYDTRLNSSQGNLSPLWDVLYKQIGRANTVISREVNITDMDPALKAVRVAEAKFLRAFAYFYLVQLWGDVPMPTAEVSSGSREVVRIAADKVYTQILLDLTEAEAVLPPTASDYGRATKGAAQFLLAKVYLTRGWNFNNSLGGQADDFNKARQYADLVIDAFPLVAQYKNLFPLRSENPTKETFPTQNDRNSEVVFAVEFSSDVLTYMLEDITKDNTYLAEGGNDAHSVFGGGADDLPGAKGRTSDYNRYQNHFVPTPAMYRLYDPQKDVRYQHNFLSAQYALQDAKNFNYSLTDATARIDILKGDTVIYFRPWNNPAALAQKGIDVGGTKRYAVLNNDQIGAVDKSRYHDENRLPPVWKFWQPGIQYGDAWGTFDLALFRSSEAYLIAAEAMLKGAGAGKYASAVEYYNKVLDRAVGAGVDPSCAADPGNLSSLAAVSYRATAANMNIDLILDERARELMGEFMRWFDLKRTGKLIERATKMNPWTASSKSELDAHHLLRPIPQSEIDRSTITVPQNDGYN